MNKYKEVTPQQVHSFRNEKAELLKMMQSDHSTASLDAQIIFFQKGLTPASMIAAFAFGEPEDVARLANEVCGEVNGFENAVQAYQEKSSANKVMAIALQAASMAVACTTQEMDEDGVAKMAATLDFDPKQLAIALQSAGVKIAGGESGQY